MKIIFLKPRFLFLYSFSKINKTFLIFKEELRKRCLKELSKEEIQAILTLYAKMQKKGGRDGFIQKALKFFCKTYRFNCLFSQELLLECRDLLSKKVFLEFGISYKRASSLLTQDIGYLQQILSFPWKDPELLELFCDLMGFLGKAADTMIQKVHVSKWNLCLELLQKVDLALARECAFCLFPIVELIQEPLLKEEVDTLASFFCEIGELITYPKNKILLRQRFFVFQEIKKAILSVEPALRKEVLDRYCKTLVIPQDAMSKDILQYMEEIRHPGIHFIEEGVKKQLLYTKEDREHLKIFAKEFCLVFLKQMQNSPLACRLGKALWQVFQVVSRTPALLHLKKHQGAAVFHSLACSWNCLGEKDKLWGGEFIHLLLCFFCSLPDEPQVESLALLLEPFIQWSRKTKTREAVLKAVLQAKMPLLDLESFLKQANSCLSEKNRDEEVLAFFKTLDCYKAEFLKAQ